MIKMNVNEAWSKLFEKYDILNKIQSEGAFFITANQIKEFKEPRLMAKWDSSENLPGIFKKHNINILPINRNGYVLSDFKLYEPIPELGERIIEMQKVEIPEYETIDIGNISSEANAINVLMLSKILDDFLDEDDNVATFNGRMGTGIFSFRVDRHRGSSFKVDVKNAQCEIDGGMENNNSVVILEAKNVVHPDFHIRQLYYPYRLWASKVVKPIRLVFSIYSNQIYRLFEYVFEDKENYSSIRLVKSKNYSLQDTDIALNELYDVYSNVKVIYDDNQNNTNIPFIQANSFERIISLMEILFEENKTTEEIAETMEFDLRQSDYYYNAGKYLGLFEKKDVEDEEKIVKKVSLSKLGKDTVKLRYKERQLKLVSLILEHEIFNRLFIKVYNSGELPTKEEIQNIMRENNVCNEGQIVRRSSSVYSWLKWIFNLQNI
ncbi:TPA: type II restriction endonuclease [Streptococcus equi subsp. zooepidemicus]|nr:type II restriction endonuclease [Streptococcus equi subsp. zooepidemicus]HEL0039608.1 type II restriction endonuclease [Streptococcus equi subsp. zooepidemicus]HEL0041646.1 type II restriction endonuclease [Streptococcus equi subsp. zooepidemicus]HEL0043702.1 type II restriction endonuclease [Streptococcus equi subsp. zooepidemicus]HEL0051693.1 type II restriction endonuclease [Streptococcus equi subsp. zooepidemicus]